VQCVCQVGFFTYAKKYEMSFDGYPEGADGMQTFLLYLCVISAPLAGIGAFFVFLIMKQGAREQLMRMLTCQCDISLFVSAAPATTDGSSKMGKRKGTTESVGKVHDARASVKSDYRDERDSDAKDAELNDWHRLSTMEEEDLEREIMLWEENMNNLPRGSLHIKNVPKNMSHVDIRESKNPVHDRI
jgi:hypothetical protein